MNIMRNRVQLIGNLGRDPEIKRFESGKINARLNVATTETYKNEKGDLVSTTQWHTVIAWGKKAESIEKYLRKGHEVIIQGKLTHRSYEDKEGITRYVSEVVLDEFMLCDRVKATVPF